MGLPSRLLVISTLLLIAVSSFPVCLAAGGDGGPVTAILFPWFSEIVGVVVFYVLSRYCHWLPFTAVMFLLGTLMGVSVTLRGETDDLAVSIVQWSKIDGHVLLLVFLPGLLFKDAFEVNVHLFKQSIGQLLVMAFPMVLGGTVLVALVAYYIFPYGWSWSLCMTFGSIMAATDPVAVSVLLNEVGAPPRLKMHVSGESLLNDGSAVVFFTIFGSMFLYELGIEGLGEDITVGQGFALFFQMSIGGALIGIAFGFGLMLLLFVLHRRLDHEENIAQVAAVISIAYLSFYVSEILAGCSGVISVVMCGITTQAFGANMINDKHMMSSFVNLVEHLLNALLFVLAGVTFGFEIATENRDAWFGSVDWGYLFLLWALMNVIRFLLVFSFYPLLSRIGLGSSIAEAKFLAFGGLRGAVGIALALALEVEVLVETTEGNQYRSWVQKAFGHVGGIAFLTLMINGTLAGPLLVKLGLAESTATREKIVGYFYQAAKDRVIYRFIRLLTDPRFRHVNFPTIAYHVPILRDLTWEELKNAVDRNKAEIPPDKYKPPNLCNVLPHLIEKGKVNGNDIDLEGCQFVLEQSENQNPETIDFQSLPEYYRRPMKQSDTTTLLITAAAAGDLRRVQELLKRPGVQIDQGDYDRRTPMHLAAGEGHVDVVMVLIENGADVNVEDRWGGRPLDDAVRMNNAAAELLRQQGAVAGGQQTHLVEEVAKDNKRSLNKKRHNAPSRDLLGNREQTIELRQIFIETLRHAYAEQVKHGELDGRGYLDKILMDSLDQSAAEVAKGKPLNDWNIVSNEEPWFLVLEHQVNTVYARYTKSKSSSNGQRENVNRKEQKKTVMLEANVKIALAYISAHSLAQYRFQHEFASGSTNYGEFAAAKERVLDESRDCVGKAKEFLDSLDIKEVSTIVSHMACIILLNQNAQYMEYLANSGLLKQKEARHFIEECDHELSDLIKGRHPKVYPGELTVTEKRTSLAQIQKPLETAVPPEEDLVTETASA